MLHANRETLRRLKAFMCLRSEDVDLFSPHVIAGIQNALIDFARASYASDRTLQLRESAQQGSSIHPYWRWLLQLLVAVIGAVICSASVQTATLTLPPALRLMATPLIAAAFALFGEELAHRGISRLRLKLQQDKESARLKQTFEAIDPKYPFAKEYHRTVRDFHHDIETLSWPWIEGLVVAFLFSLEAGSAFFLVIQDGFFLAVFAAATPPIFVLVVAAYLSELMPNTRELVGFADIYQAALKPKTFDAALSVIAIPNETNSPTEKSEWSNKPQLGGLPLNRLNEEYDGDRNGQSPTDGGRSSVSF